MVLSQVSAVNVRYEAATAPQQRQRLRAGATVGAYVALCKPRIVELLLITAVPTLFLAYRGLAAGAGVGLGAPPARDPAHRSATQRTSGRAITVSSDDRDATRRAA